jgi:hypothetical protein
LVPSTTTIGSDPENVNYLSNQDKINLMAQYTAELAMKTSLDTLASTWSVSSSAYDTAAGNISSALITAGAPSNWATTWPDGTTSGPWPGIQTSLANLWAQVATQRTALQSSISAAQASAAFAASLAVPTVVSSLPSLPSSSYPSGAYVFNTSTNMMYESTGSAWVALTVAGSSLVANSITAAQIAAGAITAAQISSGYVYAGNISANQIATGTLNAANVAVINLNASNITTGTLSASQVLFADGTALTTASRIVIYSAGQTSAVTNPANSAIAVPGLSVSVTAASGSDVFNIIGHSTGKQTAGTAQDLLDVFAYVDNLTGIQTFGVISYSALNVVASNLFFLTLTGLSAGTHTIMIYLRPNNSTDIFTWTASAIQCQRIF